jgi:hypothetical protein
MSQIRTTVLVITMLVVSAVVVASASAALPEFEGPFPNAFHAEQLNAGKLETVSGKTVECTGGLATGVVKSEKDVLINGILYTGCKSTTFGGLKCQTAGHAEGDITTVPLLGLLGYIKKPATTEVGLLFEPENGVVFASFECKTFFNPVSVTVRGTVICHLEPINVKTKNYTLSCKLKAGEKGVQNPSSFEGLPKDLLSTQGTGQEVFGPEDSGVEALSDIETEKETKINA